MNFLRMFLLASIALSLAVPAVPLSAQAYLQVSPQSLSTTLELGESAELSLAITNTSDAPFRPLVREGFPASMPAVTSQVSAEQPSAAPLPEQPERVDPQIAAEIAAAGTSRFLAVFAEQADLSAAYAIADWQARGAWVYQRLSAHAATTQAPLQALLTAQQIPFESLWVVNALVVEGDASVLALLSARPEIAALRADHQMQLDRAAALQPAALSPDCQPTANGSCWNIAAVGIEAAWQEYGVDGRGIVVATIDSGVDLSHPALSANYRGRLPDGRFDHNYSWLDLFGSQPNPLDAGDHGTHTMGTLVGRADLAAERPAIGGAPGAEWIAVRACGAYYCDEIDLMRAAQWLLAPTDLAGANPRPDLRPHLVSNSWTQGDKGLTSYAGYVAAWRAAGILPIFAAGNQGRSGICRTIQSPADLPDVIGVGASEINGAIASFSGVGPGPDNRLKPDFTAPGGQIYSSVPGGFYRLKSGTSMATPLLASVAALLLSARPELIGDYDAIYALLRESSRPISQTSVYTADPCRSIGTPNNVFGHGIVDAHAALRQVTVDVPWLRVVAVPSSIAPQSTAQIRLRVLTHQLPGPGNYAAQVAIYADSTSPPQIVSITLKATAPPLLARLHGQLRAAESGAPIVGSVSLGGLAVPTDREGRYQLWLPDGRAVYTITASANGYTPQQQTMGPIIEQATSTDFILLRNQPTLVVGALSSQSASLQLGTTQMLTIPLRNASSEPLSYSLQIDPQPFLVEALPNATAWLTPSVYAERVMLSDDTYSPVLPLPFPLAFGTTSYTSLQIGANGLIVLGSEKPSGRFSSACFPLIEHRGAILAPFRTDLDPSRGGIISYDVRAEGFLITYEAVPVFLSLGQRATFQVLIRPDHVIEYRYLRLPAISDLPSLAIGWQLDHQIFQSQVCTAQARPSAPLTLVALPQSDPLTWIGLPQLVGQLPPASQGTAQINLRWAAPAANGRLAAQITIVSNDPLAPKQRLSLNVSAAPAPFRAYFPLVR